jgi:predicted transcriptional regulator
MKDDKIKTTVRLDPDLHARLDAAAQRDRRSQHAQILSYIERGLAQDERTAKRAASAARREGARS